MQMQMQKLLRWWLPGPRALKYRMGTGVELFRTYSSYLGVQYCTQDP